MTAKAKKQKTEAKEEKPQAYEKPETKESKEITFRCASCNQLKPLDDMRVLSRFFPPLIVCRECEKGIH